MSVKVILLFLLLSMQAACCRQSFSYPVIANVTKIEVTNNAPAPVKEIKDDAQIDKIVRFIDERRSRWCAPRFGSLPEAEAMLNFYINNGKGAIGFGDGFFVANISDGKYKIDLSEAEEQEFLKLLGVSKEQVFSK